MFLKSVVAIFISNQQVFTGQCGIVAPFNSHRGLAQIYDFRVYVNLRDSIQPRVPTPHMPPTPPSKQSLLPTG